MAKGRRSSGVEFVGQLKDILATDTIEHFAKRTGKKTTNISSYLKGSLVPGKRVIRSMVRHAFEWEVVPLFEVVPIDDVAKKLPMTPGIYCLYDSSGSAIYVGQATNLKQEVGSALQRQMNFPVRLGTKLSEKTYRKYKDIATYLSAYQVESPRMRHNLEALLLRTFPNQSHNNKMGKFK